MFLHVFNFSRGRQGWKKNLEIARNPPTRMARRTSHVTPMLVLPKQSKLSFFE
jgi:hypothetical protein